MSDSTQPPKKHLLSMGFNIPGKEAYQDSHLGQEVWARLARNDREGDLADYHDADIVVELLDPMDKPQSVWAFDVAITELHNLDNRFVEKEQSMAVAADLV